MISTIKELKMFIPKVLPLVYDDTLSYYELLCKVIAKVNELASVTNELSKTIAEKVTEILNEWKEDGTLDVLIERIVHILNGKHVVVLGDSNAELFQNREPLGMGMNCFELAGATCDRLAVGGSRFANYGGNWIGTQLRGITKEPDYVLLWGGGNDISARNHFGGFDANTFKSLNELNVTNAFEGTEYVIRSIREQYPRAKIIGLIRNRPANLTATVFRYYFYIQNLIYQKYNVPVVDITKTFNSTTEVSQSNSVYMKTDGRHLTDEGCDRVAEIVMGAIKSGLDCHTEIACDQFFYDDGSITPGSNESIIWCMQNIKPKYPCHVTAFVYSLTTVSNQYAYADWQVDLSGSTWGTRSRLLNPMEVDMVYSATPDKDYRLLSLDTQLSEGDFHSLRTGFYVCPANEHNNVTHCPVPNNEGFYVIVINVVATNFRYYYLQSFNNHIMIGRKFASDANILWKAVTSE